MLGFAAKFGSGTEPTVFGSWRGDTINGQGVVNGVEMVVSATAIEANGQYYLLQMHAPLERSWEAQQYRAALGRSLTFKNLPNKSAGKGDTDGGGCANCLQIWTQAMDRITAKTVNRGR